MRAKTRLLILGAQGGLGSQLVSEFSGDPEYDVLSLARVELDVTKTGDLDRYLDAFFPQVIVNAIAYNAVDECERSDEALEHASFINTQFPAYLAKRALQHSAQLIHYSTNYVFSGRSEAYLPYDIPDPLNRYGITKLHGEEAIMSTCPHLAHVIRISNLFGPVGRSSSAKPNFFDLIGLASARSPFLEVVDDETSRFTYSRDLAFATRQLIQGVARPGIHHIVNEGAYSWYSAASLWFELTGKQVDLRPIPGRQLSRSAQRPFRAVLVDNVLPPMRPLPEALAAHVKREAGQTDTRPGWPPHGEPEVRSCGQESREI